MEGEKARSVAETNNANNVFVSMAGKVYVFNENSKQNQDYINYSGFNVKPYNKNHFIGINYTNGRRKKLGKYAMAFAMYHEMYAHIKETTGNSLKDHWKFGSFDVSPGMQLFYYYWSDGTGREKGGTLVEYGTKSWDVFKQILQKKIQDGNGTKINRKDLQYMNEYETKMQEEKKD